ncbi:Lrp/AsnC family transcriptional regulator [Candidatus Woesearchaeota archaeon]|nr:Lrp/AsnC family transcriptional regulator [Candidatus Woesearchaeota archaeon]
MFSKKDAQIISHLRNNARKKITHISKELKIPVTTVYDKVRSHEKRFVKKHATLLDFPKLGLHAKANIAIKVERNSKEELQNFLMKHPNVNSLSKINFGSDFLAEVVFKSIADVENFVEGLERNYSISQIQIFSIIEELKKEEFLTKPEHFELIG